LTIAVPESLLSSFKDFLRSAIHISDYVKTQVRVKKAIEKAQSVAEQQKQFIQYQKYSATLLSKFDSFVKSGSTPRQAIKQTRDFFNKDSANVTCYAIELIARQAGRLSTRKRRD